MFMGETEMININLVNNCLLEYVLLSVHIILFLEFIFLETCDVKRSELKMCTGQ